jgi:Fe2+ transport system protein FeoA
LLSRLFNRAKAAQVGPLTMADLKNGQRARISALVGVGPLIQRLYEMGLIEGTEITLVRRAPMGDPLEVRVMGYSLSLRAAEASLVRVLAV